MRITSNEFICMAPPRHLVDEDYQVSFHPASPATRRLRFGIKKSQMFAFLA
jgi:hypothetical protein